MFIQFDQSKYSFNLTDWVKPLHLKDKGLGNRYCKYSMEDEEGVYIGRDPLVFLALVIDQSISMLRETVLILEQVTKRSWINLQPACSHVCSCVILFKSSYGN